MLYFAWKQHYFSCHNLLPSPEKKFCSPVMLNTRRLDSSPYCAIVVFMFWSQEWCFVRLFCDHLDGWWADRWILLPKISHYLQEKTSGLYFGCTSTSGVQGLNKWTNDKDKESTQKEIFYLDIKNSFIFIPRPALTVPCTHGMFFSGSGGTVQMI